MKETSSLHRNIYKAVNKYKKNIFTVFVVFLFLIAFFLRVAKWLNFDTLAGDEGIQLITADHLIKYGDFPLTGEISALDIDDKYIVHNSPLGLYFQTLLYMLSFQTVEGYVFMYIILNLLQAVFLYKAASILFSKKAGVLTLIIALFSPTMLHTSVWTSQPVNAMFFESIAIFFFAKFLNSKKGSFLYGSGFLTLLATQMYPPMYFLLPLKLMIFLYYNKKTRVNKKLVITSLIGIMAIYLPLLMLEIKYDWLNIKTIFNFVSKTKEANETVSFFTNFLNNLRQIESYISYHLSSNKNWYLLWTIGVLAYVRFIKVSPKKKQRINIFLLSFLVPLILLSLLMSNKSVSGNRAYLFIAIPYLYVLLGTIFSKVSTLKFVFISLLVFLLFQRTFKLEVQPGPPPSLKNINNTIAFISQEISKTNHSLDGIDIFTISKGDSWSWDSPIYWYFLERESNQKLVEIEFYSSKAKRVHHHKPDVVFLICHGMKEKHPESNCSPIFLSRTYNIYQSQYQPETYWSDSKNVVYVMKKV